MSTDWRDFELLVAGIEEKLAPKGAVVKSPDRIRDLVTGKMREVDASIRFDVGSAPILITIECRKRRGVQDDTWIEQLATKRAKIGAAKTIAVSATGFSESATKTAELNGIELRSLEDRIGEEIVQEFLSGFKISMIVTEYATRTIAFELEDGSPLPAAEFGEDLTAALASNSVTAVVATEVSSGRELTIDGILRGVDAHDVPQNGLPVTKRTLVTFQDRAFTINTRNGARYLRKLELIADFTQRVVPLPATGLYEYAAPDKPLRRTIEATGEISDTEGIRLLVDIESPMLERRTPAESRSDTTTKRKNTTE